MEAGRELDERVAEALGYTRGTNVVYVSGEDINGYFIGDRWFSNFPNFSTSWEDMGVLVEEARRSDIRLWFEPSLKGYIGVAYDGLCDRKYYVSDITAAPCAICLVFLKAKGVISNA